jgi:ubiquinone/menaquinone biosynthesis C-methylase UbiE
MRHRIAVLLAIAAGFVVWRRPEPVIQRLRFLDRRSGIDGHTGARVYDRLLAPLAGWLYRREAADVAWTLRDRVAPTIVDVGTGPGLLLLAIAARMPTATIVGVDPAEPMRAAATRRIAGARLVDRVSVIPGAAERLPLPGSSVDLVVSSLSSHHWSEPVEAFRELVRVLHPGDRALIYDFRFAGLTDRELDTVAANVGIERAAITRRTAGGGPFRLLALVTLTTPGPDGDRA